MKSEKMRFIRVCAYPAPRTRTSMVRGRPPFKLHLLLKDRGDLEVKEFERRGLVIMSSKRSCKEL